MRRLPSAYADDADLVRFGTCMSQTCGYRTEFERGTLHSQRLPASQTQQIC